ncbi:MAG: glycoside hydrolase family 2 protein, partial [Cyclobacteriaceae bacterium]
AKESNHNMLRVWGGGIYEKNIFYDLCDKHGILVWQDFMFACNMYPGDSAFLESVRQEAEYNIKRLRNHPSIALWCGNNEVLAAWKAWGWEQEVAEENPMAAKAQWQGYKDIFLKVLPEAIDKLDPQRFYHPSSPQSGDSLVNVYNLGDHHYWGVWWGKEEFSNYHTQLARFMSEYGFQSFPEMRAINLFAEKEDWDIYSDVMKSHQRSSIGNSTIELYMLRDFKQPKDFPSLIYVGQVLQAEGIKQAMESHRIAMPYNMGSLYWQINDCWPVASWSSTDYYGNWKAMQYYTKKAFSEVLVAPRILNDTLEVHVVSDRLKAFTAQLELKLMKFDGELLWSQRIPRDVVANTSQRVFSKLTDRFLEGIDPKEVVLSVLLREGANVIANNNLYFERVKNLNLPNPKVDFTITQKEKEYVIELTTDALAKNVFLDSEGIGGFFSDNYFDMLPGEKRRITFIPDELNAEFENNLKVVTIRDSY